MRSYKKESRYVSLLSVRARGGHGLIEMMRYDRCCPATEQDSYKIGRLFDGGASPDDHIIRLIRYSANQNPATIGRWQSFGCVVLDERNPDAEPLTDEQLRRLANREEV